LYIISHFERVREILIVFKISDSRQCYGGENILLMPFISYISIKTLWDNIQKCLLFFIIVKNTFENVLYLSCVFCTLYIFYIKCDYITLWLLHTVWLYLVSCSIIHFYWYFYQSWVLVNLKNIYVYPLCKRITYLLRHEPFVYISAHRSVRIFSVRANIIY